VSVPPEEEETICGLRRLWCVFFPSVSVGRVFFFLRTSAHGSRERNSLALSCCPVALPGTAVHSSSPIFCRVFCLVRHTAHDTRWTPRRERGDGRTRGGRGKKEVPSSGAYLRIGHGEPPPAEAQHPGLADALGAQGYRNHVAGQDLFGVSHALGERVVGAAGHGSTLSERRTSLSRLSPAWATS